MFSIHTEAHRALELLEDYHSRLAAPSDRTLRIAIERVIRIFKSRLFQALLGKYYEFFFGEYEHQMIQNIKKICQMVFLAKITHLHLTPKKLSITTNSTNFYDQFSSSS